MERHIMSWKNVSSEVVRLDVGISVPPKLVYVGCAINQPPAGFCEEMNEIPQKLTGQCKVAKTEKEEQIWRYNIACF